MRALLALAALLLLVAGCTALPDVAHQPLYHNPFPQLSRVAVLPFYNQSAEPTVDGERVALAYYNELQAIPGFEVVPIGVTRMALGRLPTEPRTDEEFQAFARLLGVDAVVVGSITEFDPYYPPRLGLSVRWYAANPNFHPIPPGYGLPWGTAEEEFIPQSLVQEAEFALAREQLQTQTPPYPSRDVSALFDPPAPASDGENAAPTDGLPPADAVPPNDASPSDETGDGQPPSYNVRHVSGEELPPPPADLTSPDSAAAVQPLQPLPAAPLSAAALTGPQLPANWPDPRGFVPRLPSLTPPAAWPQAEPVLTHTRLYHGNDAEFTRRLASYVYFRDDARFGDWQAYLQRSDDLIRFCCHLHLTEMLAARGGASESRVVWRWPIGRYER